MKQNILVIVGPTACGKTHRAVMAARALDAEIISADSRQVYRGMDIGTGKDLDEYGIGNASLRYHLIDVRPAGYRYNLHEYLRDFHAAVADIEGRGKRVVVCGGTGMYVESALSGVILPDVPRNDLLRTELEGRSLQELAAILGGMKTLHNVTDVDTLARAVRAIEIARYYETRPEEAAAADRRKATPLNARIIGLQISREERRERISARLHHRLDNGLIEEVEQLMASGLSPDDLIYYGLEYKYVTLYLTGAMTRQTMVAALETAIHQFGKRQMTWFRGMERRGFHIQWIPYDLPDEEFIRIIKENGIA